MYGRNDVAPTKSNLSEKYKFLTFCVHSAHLLLKQKKMYMYVNVCVYCECKFLHRTILCNVQSVHIFCYTSTSAIYIHNEMKTVKTERAETVRARKIQKTSRPNSLY